MNYTENNGLLLLEAFEMWCLSGMKGISWVWIRKLTI